jgi:hypothetical protein
MLCTPAGIHSRLRLASGYERTYASNIVLKLMSVVRTLPLFSLFPSPFPFPFLSLFLFLFLCAPGHGLSGSNSELDSNSGVGQTISKLSVMYCELVGSREATREKSALLRFRLGLQARRDSSSASLGRGLGLDSDSLRHILTPIPAGTRRTYTIL